LLLFRINAENMHLLERDRSSRSSRANSFMLPAETFGMRKHILTLSLETPRENIEAISKIMNSLFMETYIILPLHSTKMCKNSDTIAYVVNVMSYVLLLLVSLLFFCL